MTKQLLQGVEFVGVLEVGIVVPWNNVHGDTVRTKSLKEHLTVAVQCLEVNEPTVLIVVAQVDDVLDTVARSGKGKNTSL